MRERWDNQDQLHTPARNVDERSVGGEADWLTGGLADWLPGGVGW